MANISFTFLIFALQFRRCSMKIVFLTIFLLALAFVLLGVKVLFVKNGKFPSGHVHDVAPLRDKGIGCASHQCEKE